MKVSPQAALLRECAREIRASSIHHGQEANCLGCAVERLYDELNSLAREWEIDHPEARRESSEST